MTTDPMIERRLAALEKTVTELQQRPGNGPPPANWLERVTGSFKDEPAFREVLEYGRAFRMTSG